MKVWQVHRKCAVKWAFIRLATLQIGCICSVLVLLVVS